MLFWTLPRRNLVQSWLDYAWRSLCQKMFCSVLFWGSWDGNLVRHVLCVRFLWTGWEIPSFLRGHCGLRCCNGALLMWSQIKLPFFALRLCVCSWETKHICKQIFCNVAGWKGNLEATADIFPEHAKLRCPLLKWWIICLILCCHMRFLFGAFPGTLNEGIDSLVLPPLLLYFIPRENDFPQNRIGGAMASCCDNLNGAKSPQKQNSSWCRFPWGAVAGQLCGRWSRPWLYQKVGKGSYDNGLYWEIKMAVIVSCTGKSGLLRVQGWARWRMWVLCAAGYVQVSWSAGGVGKFIAWLLCYLCQ